MKKVILLLMLIAGINGISNAQDTLALPADTTWRIGGFGSLQFSQVALSNWAAGGESSMSLTAIVNGFAMYMEGKNYWNSYALLSYGAYKGQYDEGIRKNVDNLELGTRAGHDLGRLFYLTGLVNFKSQFAKGYNYPDLDNVVSTFMAPGYLTISAGIDWKPVPYFSLYMSPTTGRFTFVADQAIADAGTYGNTAAVFDTSTGAVITSGKTIRSEFGALVIATLAKDIAKNVNLATKLTFFNNYTDPIKSQRDNIDVNWDLMLTMKVNSWLSANFYGSLIYDNDIIITDFDKDTGEPTGTSGPRTQFKEGLGIGLTYNIGEEARK
jgi:hypothetical protein